MFYSRLMFLNFEQVFAYSVSWTVSADFLGVSLVHNAVAHKNVLLP
jgi:hypothetical protein